LGRFDSMRSGRARSAALRALVYVALSLGGTAPAAAQAKETAAQAKETAAQAEEAEARPEEAEAPDFVPIPEVATRSESLRLSLREAVARLAKSPKIVSIEADLPAVEESVRQKLEETETLLAGSPSLEHLADGQRAWVSKGRELSAWRESLAKHAAFVEAELEAFREARGLWERTLARARESAAPVDVVAAIQANLDAIAGARKLASTARREILTLLNDVAQQELRASEAASAISSAREMIRARIFEPDSAPLWVALASPATSSSVWDEVGASIRTEASDVVGFIETRRRALLPVALAFGAALGFALFARARLQRGQPGRRLSGSAQLFERPYSIAAIAAFLAGVAALPAAPALATRVLGSFLVVPVLRVVNPLVHEAFRPILYVLTVFYLVDRVRDFADGVPVLERSIFFAQTVGGAAFLLWLLDPRRLSSFPADGERPPSALRVVIRVATGLLGGSALANLLGYTTFARVLGEGVLYTAYLSVLFYAAFRVGMTAVLMAFSSSRARSSRLVQSQGELLLRGSRFVLVAGLGFFWARNVLDAFAIRERVVRALGAGLTTPFSFGTISLSLGDVLGFGATIVAAILLSRVLRVLLNDDVLPRFSLGRGVANAIASSVQYAVLLLGFFLALGAAGVDFSRFALLAGAFGVGIGFGLQNVVNNFVSGLILLFERPIQVGDTVEVGGLLGEVKQIGIRASTVRTFQGAEVIVPNGNLISAEVINWTLSDHHRRVELPVGVAYGNRPARVIEVLEGVVSREPRVLRSPEPLVLFRGFGESSLDFEVRFWAPDYTTSLQLASDVASSIHDALGEAGIEIPFPQRDLHLKSVDGSAMGQLRRAGAPEE
jgi:potassium efflux system protein